jgi:hypothetical protein
MKGADVKQWQVFLGGQKFYQGEADGVFGKQTHLATIAFQREHGLEPDGVAGNDTLGHAMTHGFELLKDAEDTTQGGPNFPPLPDFKPLTGTAARQKVFTKFDFRHKPLPTNRENIQILGDWESKNIVRVAVPQLAGVEGAPPDGGARFHRLAVPQLLALWEEWEQAKLLDRVLSWAGAYVPRFARNTTSLSNHAFGSAFDINVPWNQLGRRPALIGQKGCVRELVTIANKHGFYWGGHFSSAGRSDGMHFEIARIQ